MDALAEVNLQTAGPSLAGTPFELNEMVHQIDRATDSAHRAKLWDSQKQARIRSIHPPAHSMQLRCTSRSHRKGEESKQPP
jgi:hypothetical protein